MSAFTESGHSDRWKLSPTTGSYRPEGDSGCQQLLALEFDFRSDQVTKLETSALHSCQRTTFIYFGRLPIEECIPDGLRS